MKLETTKNKDLLFVNPSNLPPGFRFLVFLILFTGVMITINGMWGGIFLILPGLFFSFYKEGVVFNFKTHTISNYSAFIKYRKIYRPRPLHHYKYLSIVRVGLVRDSLLTPQVSNVNLKYKLTMIKDNRNYFKVTIGEYFKVFALGKKIANHFNLGLVDYSKRYANWVIPPPKADEKYS